jgi:hypothetical protein
MALSDQCVHTPDLVQVAAGNRRNDGTTVMFTHCTRCLAVLHRLAPFGERPIQAQTAGWWTTNEKLPDEDPDVWLVCVAQLHQGLAGWYISDGTSPWRRITGVGGYDRSYGSLPVAVEGQPVIDAHISRMVLLRHPDARRP